MAQIKASNKDKVYTIKKWLGVNENPDGDTELKMGEASTMTNFKITNDNALQKRPGTLNVAGLLSEYSITTAGTTTAVRTDLNAAISTFSAYPNISVTTGGILSVSGTRVTVNSVNIGTYDDHYWTDGAGKYYLIGSMTTHTATGGTHVTGGTVSTSDVDSAARPFSTLTTLSMYTGIQVVSGNVALAGSAVSTATPWSSGETYPYFEDFYGNIYKYSRAVYSGGGYTYVDGVGFIAYSNYSIFGYAVTFIENDTYTWDFYPVTATTGSTDIAVRGIWSGRVADEEVICAACNGHLWVLSESSGVWTKTRVGTVDTTNKVHMFGFATKLYILNGVAYQSWSGLKHTEHTRTCTGSESGNYYITVDAVNYKFSLDGVTAGNLLVFSEYDLSLTLNGVHKSYTTGSVTTETNLTSSLVDTEVYDPVISVVGYRPLIQTATAPATGVGTLLERINMLNGLRRVRFSGNNSATVFYLPEKGLTSVDYVKNMVTGAYYTLTTDYTVSLVNGTVTFVTAPATVVDNVEVAYTFPTTYRTSIEAMTLSELFNGANDNRVFVYGDGSNKTYYSGLDINGLATAEYFPDLNVANVGEANTAITSMIRHYDRLLAFKEDSAYSIRYDILELVNGVTTASFYITPLNKGIGCAGYGQAQIVVNHPRTLDGRSIFEWVATTTNGNVTSDQRNAQDVSQKVSNTIRELDLTKAIAFYDKVNREYYIIEDGVAIVQNTNNGTWYVYRDFPAICMIVYKDELYFGTSDGYVRHVSRNYRHDVGNPITCYWESGSMDFGKSWIRKMTNKIWVALHPEQYSEVYVTMQSDKQDDYTEEEILSESSAVASGIFDFADLNFEHFTFNLNSKPQNQLKKIKVKNYAYLKLLLMTATTDTTCTVTSVDIQSREVGMVK